MFPGIYYGWVIVAGSSLLAFVIVGVGFYCLAVFLDGLCREHDWPRTSVALATTLFFVASGVFGTVVGRLVDRVGSRPFFVPGALLMGVALVWIGRVDSPWELYLAYPLLSLGFALAGGVPNSALITRWFVAQRVRAMSIAQTGVSLGGVVLVPVTTGMIATRGMADTTTWLAAGVVGVAVIVSWFVIRSDPESVGLEPDGGRYPHTTQRIDLLAQRRVWRSREALGTQAFWVAVIAFSGILFCQVAVAMHQIALLRERMDGSTAALAVSVTASGSIIARLVVGVFAERWNKRKLAALLMAVQAAAIGTLAIAEQPALLFGASLVFGFTIGNLFMLQSLIVGEVFGMASFGTVFGLLQLVTQTVSGLGPWVLSLVVEGVGSYRSGLLPLVGLALCSAMVVLRLRPPAPRA
jgi:MFS family permease